MGDKMRFFSAVSVLVGTCIGAGVLGIPYVAAKAGFFISLAYIFLVAGIILLLNLYLGEVVLRTKGNHQIAGYAEKYLGKRWKLIAQISMFFGIYSAIIAYLLGVGSSFSFLFFKDFRYTLLFGGIFGILMSGLLYRGMKSLKKFERIGVGIILVLIIFIFIMFFNSIEYVNFIFYDFHSLFLPFGVILFALMSFYAIPELKIILSRNKKLLKNSIITGTFISVIFYALFSFVVVGYMGRNTPEVATLALGTVFIVLGILTMFTSYLALGNALIENLEFDEKVGKFKSWFLVSIVPIILFFIIEYFGVFSFTMILSIGGVVAGGLIAIVVLFMTKSAKKNGDRNPEYSVPINWFVVFFLSFIFILGMVLEFVL